MARILIIDDDAGVRSSLGFLLKRAGYQLESGTRSERGDSGGA